jgi:hypothetical protein
MDSNHPHPDFQSGALPTELPGDKIKTQKTPAGGCWSGLIGEFLSFTSHVNPDSNIAIAAKTEINV